MSTSWERRRISEIADHSLGKMLDRAKNRGEPKPYLRNLNVRWFRFDLSDVLEMRFVPEETEKYTARKGDLLICEGGDPGRSAIWDQDEPIYFQKALHRVRFHDPERAKWFLYYLHALDLDGTLKKHFNGAGIQHFTGEALARFELPLPPLPEQRRIIGILDAAFAALATTRANTVKSREAVRGLFEAAREAALIQRDDKWMEWRLGDLATTQYGLSTPMNSDGKGYKIFRMGELQNGRLVDTGRMKFADISKAEFDKYRLRRGDVLFNRTNSYELVGKTGLFDLEGDYCFASYLVRLTVDATKVLPQCLTLVMNTRAFQHSVKQKASRSINQANINATILANERLWLPRSLRLQETIAARMSALYNETEKLVAIYEQKLISLGKLQQSLLFEAFNGRL